MAQDAENISKIRDILFGNNLTAFEKRIEKSDLLTREGLQQLETLFTRQLGELRLELENQRSQQQEAIQKERELFRLQLEKWKENLSALDQKTEETISDLQSSLREIRVWMTEKTEIQQQDFLQQIANHKNVVNEGFSEIQRSKVDRNNLAVLFSEIALQLGGETKAEQ